MKPFHPLKRRARARGAIAVVAVLLGGLMAVFFRLQVLRSEAWTLRSESNRLRPLPIVAPRGTIFDRNGRVIADNVPAYSLSVLPAPLDSIKSTLQRLAPRLDLSDADIASLMEDARSDRRRPLLVTGDATFDQISAVEERRLEFPGVLIETRPKRRYLGGRATAHVVGYVGEVTTDELAQERFRDYEQGMIIGKTGLERQYEELLHGTQGVRYVEVDALGRIVGSFRGVSRTSPERGEDLHLNLDLELQEWVHRIFPDTMQGSIVALDPRTGGVLALYSSPTYDPNAFVGGIGTELWNSLNTDPAKPLFNRSVMGLYPPASTWKLATGGIALELGVVTPDDHMELPCSGGMQFGNRYFRCWDPEGHGFINLAEAIRDSCDVYFYQLGVRIGLDRLLDAGTRLGFSRRCGIDLPQESAGNFPADQSFWEARFGFPPTEAEVLNLAIGQGPNSQSPLKMAQFYVALAGDGVAPAPTLARNAPVVAPWDLDFSESTLATLRKGLQAVVAPGGTAYMASLEHWDLMGKSGTAQNAQDPDRDHAWFAGIAGRHGGPPEIVVVALVEFGESGSGTAGPLVAKTADFYLRRKYGMEIDTIQTMGEHFRTGRPVPWWEPAPPENPVEEGEEALDESLEDDNSVLEPIFEPVFDPIFEPVIETAADPQSGAGE